MTIVNAFAAQPIGDCIVEKVQIYIEVPIPDLKSIGDVALVFDEEAEAIFTALRDSLPGGTIDRLTGKLLAYKATHFVNEARPGDDQ